MKLSINDQPIKEVRLRDINIDEVKKVVLKKGDILVLRYEGVLKLEAYNCLKKSLDYILDKVGLKGDVAVMILEQGADISILTQDEVA